MVLLSDSQLGKLVVKHRPNVTKEKRGRQRRTAALLHRVCVEESGLEVLVSMVSEGYSYCSPFQESRNR